MKKILLTLAFLFAVPAFAGSREIINPDLNGDIKVIVNKGSTETTLLNFAGTTGILTLGESGSTQEHVWFGQSVGIRAPAATSSLLRFYLDGVDTVGIGAAGVAGQGVTGSTVGNAFIRGTGIIFSGNFGATSHGSVSSAGEWTVGPASGGPSTGLSVRANGSSTLVVNRTTSAGALSGIELMGGGVRNGRLLSSSGTALFVEDLNGNTRFFVDQTGPVSIGQSTTVSSSLYIGAVSSGTTTCAARCDTEDAAQGLDDDSAVCLAAWRADTDADITCADATSVAKRCLCAGVY